MTAHSPEFGVSRQKLLDIRRRIAIQCMVYFPHDAIERYERAYWIALFMASAGVVPSRARADPPGPLDPTFRVRSGFAQAFRPTAPSARVAHT